MLHRGRSPSVRTASRATPQHDGSHKEGEAVSCSTDYLFFNAFFKCDFARVVDFGLRPQPGANTKLLRKRL